MSTSPFDESPPRRPALSDLGGGQKALPDGEAPADPVAQFTPEDANQLALTAARLARMVPHTRLSITYNAALPLANRYVISQCASVHEAVQTNYLTLLTVTRLGTGVFTIAWPAGTFGASVASPKAHVTGSAPGLGSAAYGTNLVTVTLKDGTNTAAELPSHVELF